MRPTLKIVLPTLAASLALAACGSSSKSTASSSQASATAASSSQPSTTSSGEAGSAAVKTASNATLGATVLVDAHGMTLYRLSGEQNGRFICASAACTQIWHPLSAAAAAGASVASLGTVKRPDGSQQATYKGMPLYTFASDQQAGDVKGQGLKDVGTWGAVTTSASSASPAPTASQPPASTTPPQPPPATTQSSPGRSYGYGVGRRAASLGPARRAKRVPAGS